MDRIEQDNPAELKRKLGKRLGFAAVLIVVLLGSLATFDYLSTMEREASQPVAPVQPRIGPSITSGRPGEASAPLEVPITPSSTLAPKEVPPAVEPPPKPEVSAQPNVSVPPSPAALPLKPIAAPAEPAVAPKPAPATIAKPIVPIGPVPPVPPPAAMVKPLAPVSPPQGRLSSSKPATEPVVATVPEGSSSAPVLGAPATFAPRLPSPPAAPSAVAPPRPVLSRLASGFILQAGVFTSTERAEELKAKLVMAGVPVTIESRVQVGPFATQKEADAARKKIRDLGIDSIIIPPRAGRR